ncbi:hypothetical protein G9A89_016466 [Geosiphon pyriformis]|nr:hypothetical protein G9A89_016466 [Geosiphon pyriformis]
MHFYFPYDSMENTTTTTSQPSEPPPPYNPDSKALFESSQTPQTTTTTITNPYTYTSINIPDYQQRTNFDGILNSSISPKTPVDLVQIYSGDRSLISEFHSIFWTLANAYYLIGYCILINLAYPDLNDSDFPSWTQPALAFFFFLDLLARAGLSRAALELYAWQLSEFHVFGVFFGKEDYLSLITLPFTSDFSKPNFLKAFRIASLLTYCISLAFLGLTQFSYAAIVATDLIYLSVFWSVFSIGLAILVKEFVESVIYRLK